MTWYTDGPVKALLPRPMPRWWVPSYIANYVDFIEKFAADTRLSEHPALCGVTMSAPCTQYAEPMVKQFSLVENRNAVIAENYSEVADEAMYTTAFRAHRDYLSPLGLATHCAFNDYQQISPSGEIRIVPTTTVRIIETMISILGRFAVLENNSLQYPTTKYPTMYQRMRDARNDTPANALHFQTETLPKHEKRRDRQPIGSKVTTPKKTAQTGLGWKASCIEMPAGFENSSAVQANDNNPDLATAPVGQFRWAGLDVAAATILNQQAWDNTIGLDQYHT